MSEIVVDEFDEHVGPVSDINVDDPTSVFHHFFTPDLLLMIVQETIRYTAACIEREGEQTGDQTKSQWKTSVEEIQGYLGDFVF